MARISRTHGFSTVELLIVVAVSLIIAGMAIPMIGPALANYRLIGDARSIASALSLARMRAASRFTKAEVAFDFNNGNYQIKVWNPTTSSYVLEGGVQPLNQGDLFPCNPSPVPCSLTPAVAMPTGMTPAGSQNPAQQTTFIIFNSRGICIDIGGSPTQRSAIYLTNNQATAFLAVTANLAGQPQTWRWDPVSNGWNLM